MKNKKYVGCAGFAQGYWKGIFYPEDLPSRDYLPYYSTKISAVEINSTFYRRPILRTLEKWHDATGNDFKFFVKIPKTITHVNKLKNVNELAQEFCRHISSGLKEKLAGFLYQLPPSFQYSDENLILVLKAVDPQFLNVVEFRHESWWNDDVLHKLSEKKIVFSGVSIPKNISDDVIINSEEFLYYRFHGVPILFKSEYTDDELKAVAEKIDKFKGTSFVFFNNTWGTAGIKNALEMQNLLKKGG